ncbi:site-specific integrase [Bradyrhizobium sp. 200]|uniref:tyrosine-type recombinase/integrase n=1 Tax=Bradyrhizobium sp. 200 TaxID=2782665 RepID=UPI001FFEC71F|nr:site-specific integrase [Bradyrhizobium sp. 200]
MTDEAMSPLRRRMIEDMTIRKLAPKTQHDYVQRIKNFAVFLGRSPDTATFEDVRRYQLHLAATGVGVPTLNQTVSTLRFFFRVTLRRHEIVEHTHFIHEARKLPVVLTPEEVARLLDAAPGLKYKAALSVGALYPRRHQDDQHAGLRPATVERAQISSPRLKSSESSSCPTRSAADSPAASLPANLPGRLDPDHKSLPRLSNRHSACGTAFVPSRAEICRSDVMEGQRRTNDQISRMCVRNTGRLARSSNVIPQIPRQSPCEQDRQGSLRPFFPSSTPDNFRQYGD